MRTPAEIRRLLAHYGERCSGELVIRQTWIDALEWVLAEDEMPDVSLRGLSPYAELVTAALAARSALRSYQFGNSSRELAQEIADELDSAVRRGLEERNSALEEYSTQLIELRKLVEGVAASVKERL